VNTKRDERPDPKPRKHPHLWQAYLTWDELMQWRKRHKLRISSIEAGKSNLDAQYERDWLEALQLDLFIKRAQKEMVGFGEAVGPVWDWLVGIKGIGPHTAAKLLALFDDVGKFDTVSKFWRFAGWAVIDGEIDRGEKGKISPYNRRLKSECYLVAESFVKQQTPYYADIYYAEKARQREKYPDPLCHKCGAMAEQCGQSWRCPNCKTGRVNYTPGHLNFRAMRYMIKRFLSHLYVKWCESEGLSAPEPYVQAILGHQNIQGPEFAEGTVEDSQD